MDIVESEKPAERKKTLHIVILTFNSRESIVQVVDSCRDLDGSLLVVDSYSTDDTVELAKAHGCEVVQHPFENYSRQRNWAQEYAAAGPDDWFLHLDSDEVLDPKLAESIRAAYLKDDPSLDGCLMQRLSFFLGSPIRYGHINPSWHLRLYRANKGFCEDRLYDQHYVVPGNTLRLKGLLLDMQLTTIEKWTAAHNRWSTAEAEEVFRQMKAVREDSTRQLQGSLTGDIRMKKRWFKNNIWYRTPLLYRAIAFFFYSYFLRLGFLDGKAGLVYHVLQAFWFRFLVDAKIWERQREEKGIKKTI